MRPTMRRGRGRALTTGLAAAALLAGCSGAAGYDDPTPRPGPGWSTATGTDHGGYAVSGDGPADPVHLWERSFGAPLIGSAALGVDDQIVLRLAGPGPCTMPALDIDSGRRDWCGTVGAVPAGASVTTDDRGDAYTGQPGAATAYTFTGDRRWYTPVIGAPQPPLILPGGDVLVVTHMGQISVLDPQHGRKRAASLSLVGTAPMPDPAVGLDQCAQAGPECAVPFPVIARPGGSRFHLVLRTPDAAAPVLVTAEFDAAPDEFGQGRIRELWRSDQITGGPSAAPALSADGTTLYVLGDDGRELHVVDAADGTVHLTHRLTAPADALTVTESGLVLPAPRAGGPLTALTVDVGGAAVTEAWSRTDLAAAGPVSAAGMRGYLLVAGPADSPTEPELVVLDLASGQTVAQAAVPPIDPAGGAGTVAPDTGDAAAGIAVPLRGDRVAVVLRAGAVHMFGDQG